MTSIAKIPMTEEHIEKIKQGKKWTTIRNLNHNFPFPRRKIIVPDNITPEILESEGGYTLEELMNIFKSFGMKKFPREMWLYDLRRLKGGDK